MSVDYVAVILPTLYLRSCNIVVVAVVSAIIAVVAVCSQHAVLLPGQSQYVDALNHIQYVAYTLTKNINGNRSISYY